MMSSMLESLTKLKNFLVTTTKLKGNELFTGVSNGLFYRLVIKKLESSSQKILCFSIDEEWTKYFTLQELFVIPSDFLNANLYKFQAIKVQVSYFSLIDSNLYVLDTIPIYNSKNECVDEKFLNKNSDYLTWQAKKATKKKKYSPESNCH